MAQLESHNTEIEEAGLRVVAVGLGEPKHARRYCGKLAPSIACYSNEDTDLNRDYGLTQASVMQLGNPGMIAAGVRASRAGFRQGKATGDVKMLPGTFIVDQQGVIKYTYYSKHAGDHPDLSKLIKAVRIKPAS